MPRHLALTISLSCFVDRWDVKTLLRLAEIVVAGLGRSVTSDRWRVGMISMMANVARIIDLGPHSVALGNGIMLQTDGDTETVTLGDVDGVDLLGRGNDDDVFLAALPGLLRFVERVVIASDIDDDRRSIRWIQDLRSQARAAMTVNAVLAS